jgi:hypothetical protein
MKTGRKAIRGSSRCGQLSYLLQRSKVHHSYYFFPLSLCHRWGLKGDLWGKGNWEERSLKDTWFAGEGRCSCGEVWLVESGQRAWQRSGNLLAQLGWNPVPTHSNLRAMELAQPLLTSHLNDCNTFFPLTLDSQVQRLAGLSWKRPGGKYSRLCKPLGLYYMYLLVPLVLKTVTDTCKYECAKKNYTIDTKIWISYHFLMSLSSIFEIYFQPLKCENHS